MEDRPLRDDVVVITGAAGRLGRRLTEAFSTRGAKIAAVDLNADASLLPEAASGRSFQIDLTQEQNVRDGFEQIAEHFGPIDTVVHAVGTWEARPLLETTLADWQRVVDINLTSTFLCFREAARHMRGRGGRLVAFASGHGLEGGEKEQAAYAASKAGVIRLVESMSDEFQDEGITLQAIAPSTILFDENTSQRGVRVSELIELVLYLASDAPVRALNGSTLRAYGTLL